VSVLEGDTLTFSATANDNVGVAAVEFFVNGVSAGTATLAPYTGSFALPTALVGGDIVHVEARARDFAGLSASDTDSSAVLAAPNRTPTANAGGPYTAQVGAPIELSAALSSDPDQNDALVYHWNFGDDTTGSGLTPRHAFAAQGTFTATLTVDDGRGGVGTATAPIVVSPATDRSAPSITLTGPSAVLPASQITMTARATDDVGVVAVTFVVNGANPTEAVLQPYQRLVVVPGVAAPGDSLKVTATARDAAGNEGTAEAVLTITGAPDTQNPTVSLIAPPQIGAGTTLRFVSDC
jgi:PKD repeat protein